MSDFKERLELEANELAEKFEKLNIFLMSEKAEGIDPLQKALLTIQSGAMYTYLVTLKTRLENL